MVEGEFNVPIALSAFRDTKKVGVRSCYLTVSGYNYILVVSGCSVWCLQWISCISHLEQHDHQIKLDYKCVAKAKPVYNCEQMSQTEGDIMWPGLQVIVFMDSVPVVHVQFHAPRN